MKKEEKGELRTTEEERLDSKQKTSITVHHILCNYYNNRTVNRMNQYYLTVLTILPLFLPVRSYQELSTNKTISICYTNG
jgi:hypothetical protein